MSYYFQVFRHVMKQKINTIEGIAELTTPANQVIACQNVHVLFTKSNQLDELKAYTTNLLIVKINPTLVHIYIYQRYCKRTI